MAVDTLPDVASRPWSARDTTQEKRPFIRRLFTEIAPQYDWFNRIVSCGLDLRWRDASLRWAGVAPGMRILDVCAGTGDLALACARRMRGQGTVVGLDMTAAMLTRAQRKQRRAGLSAGWTQADALALPFAEGAFDRVVIGFSTRNLSDLEAGIREMVRVLKPGGQLMILETGRPANPVVRAGYYAFLFTIARLVGVVLTGRLWPFTYLARSVKGFLTPAELTALLERAGTRAACRSYSGGLASGFLATKRAAA